MLFLVHCLDLMMDLGTFLTLHPIRAMAQNAGEN